METQKMLDPKLRHAMDLFTTATLMGEELAGPEFRTESAGFAKAEAHLLAVIRDLLKDMGNRAAYWAERKKPTMFDLNDHADALLYPENA